MASIIRIEINQEGERTSWRAQLKDGARKVWAGLGSGTAADRTDALRQVRNVVTTLEGGRLTGLCRCVYCGMPTAFPERPCGLEQFDTPENTLDTTGPQ
jgi:hypothetical protein